MRAGSFISSTRLPIRNKRTICYKITGAGILLHVLFLLIGVEQKVGGAQVSRGRFPEGGSCADDFTGVKRHIEKFYE